MNEAAIVGVPQKDKVMLPPPPISAWGGQEHSSLSCGTSGGHGGSGCRVSRWCEPVSSATGDRGSPFPELSGGFPEPTKPSKYDPCCSVYGCRAEGQGSLEMGEAG